MSVYFPASLANAISINVLPFRYERKQPTIHNYRTDITFVRIYNTSMVSILLWTICLLLEPRCINFEMPRFCAAYGCVNASNKIDCLKKEISFHRFPLKEPRRLQLWQTLMKRKNFVPSVHSVLCSEHFEKDCFENISPAGKRRILKHHAIPTKFSFSKVKQTRMLYQIG